MKSTVKKCDLRCKKAPDLVFTRSTANLPLHGIGPVQRLRRHPIINLIFSLPSLVVIGRFLWPLHIPLLAKGILAVLILVAAQYHFWSRLSSGSIFSPEFPRAIVILFNWALGTILLLAVFQLTLDCSTLIAMLLRRTILTQPDSLRYAMAIVAAVLTAYGVHQAIRIPPVKDIEIALSGLPPQFDGYKILQLTDLHISRLYPQKWTRAIVDRSNALGADAIVVTGDFIDGTIEKRETDVEPLHHLRAPDGVYFIPGNHEYFFGYEQWMRHFSAMGLHPLANAHAVLARDGGMLVIAGVTDLSARATGNPPPDLQAALKGAPPGAPVILLDHQPRDAPNAAAAGVAVQLSGHTHGGMIRGLDRLVARANGGFVSGRYDVAGMTLYVNNGTALWAGFAIRLGRPSELTRITLRRVV
jgi:predicted MPP superfamily phosphohydrolase